MLEDNIINIIEKPMLGLGYRVVRIKLFGAKHNPILQIMAERLDATAMAIADCEAISRHIGVLLDVNDAMATAYRLEVSSPGIDRPLINVEDFIKNKGYLCSLCLKNSTEKGKRFKATIEDVYKENGGWWLDLSLDGDGKIHRKPSTDKKQKQKILNNQTTKTNLTIEFDNIESAKLVITEELMRQAIKKQNLQRE